MQKFMDLTVIDVKSPDCILVREAPSASPSQNVETFKEMSREMNDYFNDQYLVFDVHFPKNNEICAALINKHGRWHRVRIKQILSSLRGPKVSCFLLDTGKVETIQVQNIRQIPLKFLEVPFQAKTFVLLGVQPLTLSINSDIQAVQRPCKVWDKSVTTFIRDLFREASMIQAIVKTEKASRLFGHMYLKIPGKEFLVSLNDRLVQEKYAIFGSGHISNLSEEEPEQNCVSSSEDMNSSKVRDSLSPIPLKNCRSKESTKYYGSFLPDSLSPEEVIERKKPERLPKGVCNSHRSSSRMRRVSTCSDSDSSPSICTRRGYMQYLEKVKSQRQKHKSLESILQRGDGEGDKENTDGSSSPPLAESAPQLPQLEDIPKESPGILRSTKKPHRKSHLGSRENIDMATPVTLAGRGRGQGKGRGKLLNWGLTACNNNKDSHSEVSCLRKSKMVTPVTHQDVSNQKVNQQLHNTSGQSSSDRSRIGKANKSLSSKKWNSSARNSQRSCSSDYNNGDSLDDEEIIRGQSVIGDVLPSGSRIQRINKILGNHNKISSNDHQLRSIPTLEEISSEGSLSTEEIYQPPLNDSGKHAPKNSSNFSLYRSSEVFSSSESYPASRNKNSDNESNNDSRNNNRHGLFYRHCDQEDDNNELDLILSHLRSVRKTSNASSWHSPAETETTGCSAKTTIENTSPQSLASSSSSASSLLSSNCKIQFNHSTSSPQSKWILPVRSSDSKCSESELDKHQRNSEVPEEISKLSIGKRLHSRSSNQSDVFLKK
ncbi:uncharacterized protein LOC106875572 [Octopus bimaculoides]|uniref:RNA helicase n=1 Tax=Octopus bimaculoides TaxID=37653 RepID=A0A0L8GPN3_OCTBM|nr:uncharacterized protein LOC106875572 [Octopus bimaculoides]|eukprot:XP_014779263.1 PREDICTED: uncharacterized protein LOC106875572 [Octopus bimaculoides]